MVLSKADREKQKLITDKCQSLIEVLLKDDDNKYCVDCDAKGPRWASWNLGIFLCIRCAGIHRNLGVHISRVKSVNLDAWTPEHVAYVQRMGNSRARAIYEANLPEDFRRPQTDTALESFIRAKYEHKKYIAHDYVDPGPPEPAFNVEEEFKRIKEQKRSKIGASSGSHKPMLSMAASVTETLSNSSKPRPIQQTQQQKQTSDSNLISSNLNESSNLSNPVTKNSKSALDDLMDLDLGFGANNSSASAMKSSNTNSAALAFFGSSSQPLTNQSQLPFTPAPSAVSTASVAPMSNFANLADLMTPSMNTNVRQFEAMSFGTNPVQQQAPRLSASFLTPSIPLASQPSQLVANMSTNQIPMSDTSPSDTLASSNRKNVLDLMDL